MNEFDTRPFLKLDPSEWGPMLEAQWRPFPAFVGPVMPPMIAWLKRGGQFHSGGPYPGTINYVAQGELPFPEKDEAAKEGVPAASGEELPRGDGNQPADAPL